MLKLRVPRYGRTNKKAIERLQLGGKLVKNKNFSEVTIIMTADLFGAIIFTIGFIILMRSIWVDFENYGKDDN